eukprot:scaffold162142_cov49-Prasinocladus_malaysianus.AAC.2
MCTPIGPPRSAEKRPPVAGSLSGLAAVSRADNVKVQQQETVPGPAQVSPLQQSLKLRNNPYGLNHSFGEN